MTTQQHPTECRRCGTQLHRKMTGRPAEYCSPACRRAAYRKRAAQRSATASGVAVAAVAPLAAELEAGVRELVRILENAPDELVAPVERIAGLRRTLDDLTAGLVGRARAGRVSWRDLAKALAMCAETARRTFHPDSITRRLSRPRPPS